MYVINPLQYNHRYTNNASAQISCETKEYDDFTQVGNQTIQLVWSGIKLKKVKWDPYLKLPVLAHTPKTLPPPSPSVLWSLPSA